MFLGIVKLAWDHIGSLWKALLISGGFIILHWFILVNVSTLRISQVFLVLLLIVDMLAICFVILNGIAKSRIRRGIQEIAGGNVHHQILEKHLRGEALATAKLVNSIGNGLEKAIEESVRSERLKTELITNVSHDIKTPLTSIVNYVDLLKRDLAKLGVIDVIGDEKSLNEDSRVAESMGISAMMDETVKARLSHYIKVLETKGKQLRILTDDVLEAAKVSSGNVTLEYMNLNLEEIIQQVQGEFSERLDGKKLTLIPSLPQQPTYIYADGKKMWRVLENIFSNVVNYAMMGTRVYLDVQLSNGNVSITLKNISGPPLNISSEELTERFIRGDVSRSTEGSGLGLSIAQSLVELQHGAFQVVLDGDLFKVLITFPTCSEN